MAGGDGGKDEGAVSLGGDVTERLMGRGGEALRQHLVTTTHNLKQVHRAAINHQTQHCVDTQRCHSTLHMTL